MSELQIAVAVFSIVGVIVAISMPLMLFILRDIRESVTSMQVSFTEHVAADAQLAQRVALLEEKTRQLDRRTV